MNLFKTFNKPETTVVITSFPNPKDGSKGDRGFNAVGWHSQKTLVELSKSAPVLVLAEKRDASNDIRQTVTKPVWKLGNEVRRHTRNRRTLNDTGIVTEKRLTASNRLTINDNLTVLRVWEKGNIFSILSLYSSIAKLDKVTSVFVQFEFNVFGGILPNLTLLFVLMLLRLSGKKVTFELHQVITDVGLLKKHVPVGSVFKRMILNLGLVLFYVLLGIIVSEIIVFEETLRQRLSRFVRKNKIHTLSLSVQPKRIIDKQKARKKLKLNEDEFIVMAFGFINGYKGIDWITHALSDTDLGNVRLLVAGGMNPYLKDKPHYQKLYHGIVSEINKHAHMTHTGFVPDEMVDYYFAACDLVVLPYEVFMSASGPFSLALSYKKPVLLSEKLKPYAESEDVLESLIEAKLSVNELFFPLEKSALLQRLYAIQKRSKYKKYENFSLLLSQKRASSQVIARLHDILHAPSSQPSFPLVRVEVVKS